MLCRRSVDSRWCFAYIALLFAVHGCAVGERETGIRASALGGDSELRGLFEDVGEQFGVPAEILATVYYVETRLRFEDARTEVFELAAAMVEKADGVQASAPFAAWAPALAGLAGGARTGQPMADEVLRRIGEGWRGKDADGHWLVCSARDVGWRDTPEGIGSLSQGIGYPGAHWDPASSTNYTDANRGADDINYVIVHTMQGSYAGCISWFKNASANVSAHYVVRSSDGDITQMVDDRDVAWHDGCFNTNTIGIEHEGYVDAPDVWYTEEMYMASAQMVAWLADQWTIPLDRSHIMGHGEAPDCSDHTDPGSGWDWDHYMDLIQTGGNPVYGATYVASSFPERMQSGEEAVVWFEFQNDSNVTWGLNETRLGTAEPQDRESAFYLDGNWLSPSRPTGADHSDYAPGAVGRFTFAVQAPEVSEPTEFVEHFQPVQEGRAWFGPTVAMTITVVPVGWEDPPPEVPWPGPREAAPGSLASIGDSATGDRDPALAGGCRIGAADSSGASGAGCAILLLGALFLVRRRRVR